MSSTREILVLHASADELHLTQARLGRDQVHLSDASSFLCSSKGQDASGLRDETTLDALAEFVRQRDWVGQDLVCVIGGSSVACQHYDMPPLKGDALRKAVLLKLGEQLHYDLANAVVAFQTPTPQRPKATEQIRVTAAAVHQDLANAAINAAARAGLNVIAVCPAPAVLAAVAQDNTEEESGLQAFLHVDERLSTLVVLDGVVPFVTSELPVGLGDLSQALMRPIISGDEVIQLDEDRAIALRNEVGIPAPDQKIDSLGAGGDLLLPLLEPVLQQFTKQITQWLTFAGTAARGGNIQTVRLVGPGASIPGLTQALDRRLAVEVRDEHWLEELAVLGESAEGRTLDSFAVTVGAVRHWQTLPDLIPPEFHRQRRMHRIRNSVSICGSVAALAIVTFALLFDYVGDHLFQSMNSHRGRLSDVQSIVATSEKCVRQQETVDLLQERLDRFSRFNPSWVGVFKELAVLLPREVQAREFRAESSSRGIRLIVSGAVHSRESSRSFDEAVEQTLLLLQRSSFFERVRLLTANRRTPDHSSDAAGTLTVELDLAYPRPKV
jgi:Tfp pilus assembly PilM family ATPase